MLFNMESFMMHISNPCTQKYSNERWYCHRVNNTINYLLATVSTAVFVGPQQRTFSRQRDASRYAMRAPVFDLPVPVRNIFMTQGRVQGRSQKYAKGYRWRPRGVVVGRMFPPYWIGIFMFFCKMMPFGECLQKCYTSDGGIHSCSLWIRPW